MMSFLFFPGVAILLTVEGRWILALISRGNLTKAEEWALGFPLGAFVNALLFFTLTVIDLPLSAAMVFGGHGGIFVFIGVVSVVLSSPTVSVPRYDFAPLRSAKSLGMTRSGVSKHILSSLLTLSIAIKLFYGASHALLPSYSYDTVSQWNMRAKISYEDRAIAFDRDEARGMSKPQYPILVHSLQIVFNLPRFDTSDRVMLSRLARSDSRIEAHGRTTQRDTVSDWSDSVANGATLILSLTGFLAFFLLLRRLAGSVASLIILACILTIPLIAIHLAQGYGDIHVLEYVLLSAVLFIKGNQGAQGNQRNQGCMLLSAVFIAASAWVKQEGLVFGVGAWMIIVGLGWMCGWFESSKVGRFRGLEVLKFGGLVLLLSLPWSLLLLLKGLPLSPHGGGDLAIGWHPEGVPLALKALFAGGSFGIHWYVAIGLLLVVLFERRRMSGGVEKSQGVASRVGTSCLPRRELLILLWGIIAFLGALFIFLGTSNIEFLINAQTFSRTMLLPLALLILGSVLTVSGSWHTAGSDVHSSP